MKVNKAVDKRTQRNSRQPSTTATSGRVKAAKDKARRFGLRLQGSAREGVVVVLLALCVFLLLALFSYHPADPGWSYQGPEAEVRNWMGAVGAWLADVLYSLLGASALWWPGMFGYAAWWLMRSRQVRFEIDPVAVAVHSGGLVLLIFGTTMLGALHFYSPDSILPYASGGILGEGLVNTLKPLVSGGGVGLISAALMLVGFPLFSGVSWLQVADELGSRLCKLGGWINARRAKGSKKRAERTAARAAAKVAAQKVKEKPLSEFKTAQQEGSAIRASHGESERRAEPAREGSRVRREPSFSATTDTSIPWQAAAFSSALSAKDTPESVPQETTKAPSVEVPAASQPEEKANSATESSIREPDAIADKPAPEAEPPENVRRSAEPEQPSTPLEETATAEEMRAAKSDTVVSKPSEPREDAFAVRASDESDETAPSISLSAKESTPVSDDTAPGNIPGIRPIRQEAEEASFASFTSPRNEAAPSVDESEHIDELEHIDEPERVSAPAPEQSEYIPEQAPVTASRDDAYHHAAPAPRYERVPEVVPEPVWDDEDDLPEPGVASVASGVRQESTLPSELEEKDADDGPALWTVEHLQSQRPAFETIDEPEGDVPSLQLLTPPEPYQPNYTDEQLADMAELLEVRLREYGVKAEVVDTWPGPVITRFEIKPAAGVKVSKISNLAKDLARSLMVKSVRVVEVIPGRPTVGIEIPNPNRAMIRLREVIDSDRYQQESSPLTMALGQDIGGGPVVANLGKMPHLLVAGTTGSGKSVGVNAMLISMLLKAKPSELKLIMVDPKMLELSVYDGIPHLLAPVVTDMKEAANSLRWCVAEMERRYKLMAAMGVRNIAGFNARLDEAEQAGAQVADPLWEPEPWEMHQTPPILEKLPYIVVVIDEFADMFMIVGKKVEELIARLAQKARAAGIHLILATQRPSVDVVTGLIKANIPSRMAFQVSSRIDSRTILDQGGAESLLGHGDMLYLPAGSGPPNRIHGAFVDDDEVHRVVDDWKRRGAPEYIEEILSGGVSADALTGLEAEGVDGDDAEQDALYDEAVQFVTETRRASISAVQRRFKIGYNRAARLVEAMEGAGVVTSMGTNGAREVLAPPPVGH